MNNEFAMQKSAGQQGSSLMNAEIAKAVQEIQASLVIAKNFPRDQEQAFDNIMIACQRKKLAEESMYAYPRGNTIVTGPSIRLAEALAQNWGNIDYGIRELSSADGVSEIEAYCWDMQTNTRSRKIFRVRHFRHTKGGGYELTDPRDIYEMTANQGARRLRACILAVIPGDVVDAAIDQCEKTLAGNTGQPIENVIGKMLPEFAKLGVTTPMIETRLGKKIEFIDWAEVNNLRKIYKSINENMASVNDFFEMDEPAAAADIENKLKSARKPSAKKSSKKDDKPKEKDQPTEDLDIVDISEAVNLYESIKEAVPNNIQNEFATWWDGPEDQHTAAKLKYWMTSLKAIKQQSGK